MAVIEAIETIYLEADAVSVTTATLPTTYEHLQVRLSLHSERAGTDQLYLRPNSSTVADYNFEKLEAYGSTVSSDARFTDYPYFNLYEMPYVDSDAASYGTYIIDILDYRNTSKNTTIMYTQGMSGIAGTAPNKIVFGAGVWDTTAEITTLQFSTISAGFTRGSSFSVYGITG